MTQQPADAARWYVAVSIRSEGHDDVRLAFDRSPISIGGSAKNDVVLSSPYVSRTHATVSVSAGRLVFRDQSSNGSFIDGRRVHDAVLGPDDVVVIPPCRLSFSLETHPEPATLLRSHDEHDAEGRGGAPELAGGQAPRREGIAESRRDSSAASRRRSPFELTVTTAPATLQGRQFSFAGDIDEELIVGRNADSAIQLDLQSISRRHAALRAVEGGRWCVKDLGSRNGVRRNGIAVDEAVLADGDAVAFGPDVIVRFAQKLPTRPGTATPAPAAAASDGHDELLSITHRRSGLDAGVIIVAVGGRIDGYNYVDFKDRLIHIIEAGERHLVIDFAGCTFCDHVGLGVVLSAKTALDKKKGGLCLIGLNDMMREGLALLRLNALLGVEPDEKQAVRRLSRR